VWAGIPASCRMSIALRGEGGDPPPFLPASLDGHRPFWVIARPGPFSRPPSNPKIALRGLMSLDCQIR
jgi:hypothetical protein